MSLKISRPHAGYGTGDFLRGVRVEQSEPEATNKPLRSRQRENISDAARWRAEAYAQQSNSRNWQSRTEENTNGGLIDIKRAEARLQVLNWLADKKQSVVKR